MKLGENIFKLRKEYNLSQEQLAEKINVTRQTISNWELGETAPNPEQLKLLSKELNISIDELLNNDIKQVLVEKVSNTEKLAKIIIKILKILGIIFVLGFVVGIFSFGIFNSSKTPMTVVEKQTVLLNCQLNGEKYDYLIEYDKDDNIIEAGGSDYITNIVKDKKIYTFGDDSSCDFYYSNIRKDETGTIFSVTDNINNVTRDYKITIAGEFNCINACLVIGICSILNISYESILKGLLKTKVIGRMSIYKGKCTLIVDYAHNKISVDALMKALKKDYPNSKIRLVFGCPGDRGVNRRKDVGILAGMYADYIYLTAEDPQTKKISDICDEIISYIKPFNKPYEVIEDRELAIKKAYDDASNDDVIAVIGKGDETYQIVNGEYVYYKSDVKVAEELTKNTVNV